MGGYSHREITKLCRMRCCDQHFVIGLASFGSEIAGDDPQLGNNIDESADAAFEGKEFVQNNHFLLFEDTIAALEIASLIAYDVFCLVQDALELI